MKTRISVSSLYLICCFFLLNLFACAQDLSKITTIHPSIFRSNNKQFEHFLRKALPAQKNILDSVSKYRLQIYLAQMDVADNGDEKITYYQYPAKVDFYTYPASIVKFPMAVLFLQKLDEINARQPQQKISLNDRLFIDDSLYCGQLGNNGIVNGMRIGSLLQELMQKSNNTAFNPLYDVVRDYQGNQEMDFMKEIFQQRFSSQCDYLANSTFAAYHIEDASGKILYSETSANKTPIKRLERSFAFAGKAYLDDKDSLINTARTFENSNFVSLEDAHQLLVRLALSENDFSFFSRIYWDSLFSYMCNLPATDSAKGIYPSTFKYLYYGSDLAARNSVVLDFPKTSRDLFKMYNKVGQAYGFLSDVAYFESEDKKTKFVLAASVFVDRDGVLNDGKYAYDEIGFPFFAELGKRIFLSEYKRTHKK